MYTEFADHYLIWAKQSHDLLIDDYYELLLNDTSYR